MGLVYANIRLSNPVMADREPIQTRCLEDSGSTFLCIPQHLAFQFGLKELQRREVVLADGTPRLVPYAGPIKIEFENRLCFVGAMVVEDECVLGAVPMEDMDLVIHPKLFKLSVNPESPNIARGYAK